MSRQKISEFRAKTILCDALGLPYSGRSIDTEQPIAEQLAGLPPGDRYVVKVDQAVKGRFKKGLVLLDIAYSSLPDAIATLQAKNAGYRWLLVEQFLAHDQSVERYVQLTRDRRGICLTSTPSGGIDVEKQTNSLQTMYLLRAHDYALAAEMTGISQADLRALAEICKQQYFTFLEINPYILQDTRPCFLDVAAEVDDAAATLAVNWSAADVRHIQTRALTKQEQAVIALKRTSPASFSLTLLNPDGAIFVLLSGGGASVVVADEIYVAGYGKQLANYGEYSGDPTTDETYVYTRAVLELLLASKAAAKCLIIGGAVANFTDIAQTFAGVIRAIEEVGMQLQDQSVKVFVRRGGPHQTEGLAAMQAVLLKYKILGAVHDQTTTLPAVVQEAMETIL